MEIKSIGNIFFIIQILIFLSMIFVYFFFDNDFVLRRKIFKVSLIVNGLFSFPALFLFDISWGWFVFIIPILILEVIYRYMTVDFCPTCRRPVNKAGYFFETKKFCPYCGSRFKKS